jgi:hypothetical protein
MYNTCTNGPVGPALSVHLHSAFFEHTHLIHDHLIMPPRANKTEPSFGVPMA